MEYQQMHLLFSVLPSGRGKAWMKQLEDFSVFLHLQCPGHGTASNEMRDILGLETNEKDVVLSLGGDDAVKAFAADLNENMVHRHRLGGLVVILKPEAVNYLLAVIAAEKAKEQQKEQTKEQTQEGADMKDPLTSEFDFSMILVAVNRGFTDDVMKAARKAGAAGGTVIRARLADTEHAENFYGLEMRPDKDILMILTSEVNRNTIMEAINKDFGLRSPAQSILCALPVEKAYKI